MAENRQGRRQETSRNCHLHHLRRLPPHRARRINHCFYITLKDDTVATFKKSHRSPSEYRPSGPLPRRESPSTQSCPTCTRRRCRLERIARRIPLISTSVHRAQDTGIAILHAATVARTRFPRHPAGSARTRSTAIGGQFPYGGPHRRDREALAGESRPQKRGLKHSDAFIA